MKMQHITSACLISAMALSVQADNGNNNGGYSGQNWMPPQIQNQYWQTPNWSNFNSSQSPGYAPPPNTYRNPAPQNYRPSNPAYNQQPNRGQPNMNRPSPNGHRVNPNMANPNMASPPNNYRGNRPPPPNGPYRNYGRDNGASAFNVPGYNRYRNNSNNGWNNNKFWGQSGPSRWMNPNKNNMEQGWDDMINAPSRMGEMPGGWTAPEVSMPNPIDMGDQMQDNLKDLPEQIRDMDVGN